MTSMRFRVCIPRLGVSGSSVTLSQGDEFEAESKYQIHFKGEDIHVNPDWLWLILERKYAERIGCHRLVLNPDQWVGRRVTTKPQGARDFTIEGQALRRVGEGVITGYSNSHGLCFSVRHGGGAEAYYDPDEIELVEYRGPTVWDRLNGEPLV